ncbi:MAG: FAD-dependent oxidoreductase [Pseudomonadota bacterium]
MVVDSEIAVIGAGMAGLSCARALANAGRAVMVIEKSRGIGGRIATRRRDGMAFDHGAPYVTATGSAAFGDLVQNWRAEGHLQPWDWGGSAALVAEPGMSALARPLAEGLDIAFETTVTALEHASGVWSITADGGDGVVVRRASSLVLAVPPPQARALLGAQAARLSDLTRVEVFPQWTTMIAFDPEAAPPPTTPIKGNGAALAAAIPDGAKPGRDGTTWVLHAGHAWSETHLEAKRPWVGEQMLKAFATALDHPLAEPSRVMVHRWRYARTRRPLGRPCLWEADMRLGLAGDWCLGAAIGDAHASGLSMAKIISGPTSA